MNEIEKMYENCNLLKPHGWSCELDRIGDGEICELKKEVLHCKNCKYSKQEYYHKPLTAEKQIELIKFVIKKLEQCYGIDPYCQLKTKNKGWGFYYNETNYIGYETFEASIAGAINTFIEEGIFKDKEKQQIKEILE